MEKRHLFERETHGEKKPTSSQRVDMFKSRNKKRNAMNEFLMFPLQVFML